MSDTMSDQIIDTPQGKLNVGLLRHERDILRQACIEAVVEFVGENASPSANGWGMQPVCARRERLHAALLAALDQATPGWLGLRIAELTKQMHTEISSQGAISNECSRELLALNDLQQRRWDQEAERKVAAVVVAETTHEIPSALAILSEMLPPHGSCSLTEVAQMVHVAFFALRGDLTKARKERDAARIEVDSYHTPLFSMLCSCYELAPGNDTAENIVTAVETVLRERDEAIEERNDLRLAVKHAAGR